MAGRDVPTLHALRGQENPFPPRYRPSINILRNLPEIRSIA